ncbi:filamentous hemagglutinin N-terminal domain-containing protein [Sphingomonas sp. HITSZ_GF]|uniref:beta strand repeat-containing protein n=1 Tax=Sphingomonas sp. HITSZ_GF TaxID=3037247 RepID=UPI00240E15E8|nr:filamentous hemagglutinin N-terminal domain-containing protein [Sphingomonas sp. HITSZ_GF]MDG2535998.1 filamentous hemagglutinin N-terminal domain-containing protein [Sphingomonas sp. HITSZ_GF]
MSKLNTAKAVIASSKGPRRLKRSAWLLSAAVAAITLANPAHAQLAADALPSGGNVVAGSATIGTPTPTSMSITQGTERAVINWNSFDIGSGASVTFVQPSTTAIAVNRVTGGGAPSEIAGQLTANGRVAILNPNGVLFSGTADVNVASLIASTGDIDDTAFMAGGNLDITGATSGSIVVEGHVNITAGNLGLAAFVAPTVRNSGVITARAGRVQLGSGTAFTVDLAGDGLLEIGVPASSGLLQNTGSVFAEGGHIQMSARTAGALVDNVVNAGTLSVDSATLDNGTIVLSAVGGNANLSGTLAANDRNSISRNILISSDRGVNISGNLSGASGTVNITAPHIWGTGRVSTGTALNLNLSNNGTDTTGLGNYINDALGVIGTTGFGTTIRLGAGTYRSGVNITQNDVTIDGQGVAKIGWTSGIENAINISSDYVTIRNLEIFGPAVGTPYTSFTWDFHSRGIFVYNGADNIQLLNNNIHDIRTGIILDGRNVNAYVLDNTIDNTKSAISIQYTDGSNIVMTGNHGGAIGNEWGINLYLNGILQADGVTLAPSGGSLGANTPLAEQQRLLALRAANGGMEVQNQGYSALNRTAAYVSATGSNSNQGSPLGQLATIQAGVNAVVTGGTVHVADGNYNLGSSQLVINHALSLVGQSQAGVVIDGRAVSANGLGTISVIADNVSLSNFTLLGSQLSTGNYGIKVQPNSAGHVNTAGGDTQRVSNFAISNVTVTGSRRAELDLNGVVGATITNFTANGQGTDGAGVQITDSANIVLTGVHTLGNNWGGVALYQSNGNSGYNAQTTNITIDASQNNFEEANGLFTQDSSTTQNFGTLNLSGFNYAIRNTGSRSDASQFVWFQTDLSDATSFALALGAPTTSSIEGWDVTAGTNQFTVVAGMGVDAAVRDARAGATINVGIGTFTFSNTLMIDKSLSLIGASETGTIFDASALGVYGMRVHADNVSLSGFTLLAPGAVSNSTYGIKVEVGAGDTNGNARIDDFAISNVTISGSRKTGLDLNSVIGATIDNVNVTGALAGNGISITDSANVTVRDTTTSGNAWGGLALYQANGATGSNQQLTGITIENNNSFGESNGLYLQDSSTINDVGTLSIAGFDYIVRNTAFRSDGSQFTFFRTSLTDAQSYALSLATPTSSSIEGWAGSAGDNQFSVFNGMGITAALRDARAGATISIAPGSYTEGVTGVDYYGGTGAQSFGLYVAKDNITLRGIDAAGNAITDADDVVAFITARYQAGFGAQHFISGNGVTIEGLGFLPAAAGDNKTVEVIGNAFTLRNSVIDNRGNQTAANLYIDDFNDPSRTRLESFTITGNNFYGGTYASAMVVVAAGAGRSTDASNRIFSDNYLSSGLTGMRGFQIQGYMPNTPWQQLAAGAVTVTGNTFDVDIPVRTVGVLSSTFDWNGVFYGNDFVRGGVLAFVGDSTVARATTTAGGDPDVRITSTIDASLARAQSGDTVRILDGTYVLGSQLSLTTSISLIGQSQDGTILDGRNVNNGGGLGTIGVYADNTTLSNFTLLGSTLSGGNYGIKVQPNPLGYTPTGGADQRISNVTISDVTVRGSRRAELDINGAIGVTVTNFTADGAGTDGAGVQITDSANVTLTGVHTLNNNWGGVALYQTNRAGGYNGQTTNININAAENSFDEANGLFAQLESTTQGFGQLNLTGYDYAVRNTGSRADGNQFTYFRTTLADATAWALGLGAPNTSSIEGYSGTAFTNVFTVVNGLSIAAAARDVRANGTINVGAGTYGSGTVLTASGVSLLGAAGAKIDASHDGDNGITINADGVTVSGFEIFGPANQSYVSYAWPTITRGIVVSNGADNVTVTGNNIHDVRNGILIDGRNANTALTNNVIDNTKSAISVQYTDGSGLTIAGNSEGVFGNEWGIITYLNGIWNGSTIATSAGALGPNTPLSEQQRLLALSAANGGMAVYNQGYSAANRTRAYVTTAGVAGAQGSQRTLLNLQGGLDAVVAGGTVYIGAGTYNENVSLDALRVLSFAGPITVNSLSFGAGAAGTNIATDLTATGALSFAVAPVLTGNTTLTGDTISLGAITSAYGLTLNGANGVSIGLADLASLVVSGSNIVTAGVTTSGVQSYTGDITLNGEYRSQGGFTVTGLATLAGDSLVGSTTVALGGVTGAHDFTVLGTAITLGQVSGLASLSARATTISTAGVSTTGDQSYVGATTLNGAYSSSGGYFAVDGATTLGGNVSVTTNGTFANFLGTVSGAHDLVVDAGSGNIGFGAVSGLTSLSATGAAISTLGVATQGDQLYVGATTLAGTYTTGGGSLTVQGASSLAGATSIVTNGGAATLGAVNTGSSGISDLAIDAGAGQVTLGTTFARTLAVTGATIVTAGAGTNGAQTYNGATTLNGTYNASSFTVNGATTLGGNTSISGTTTALGSVGGTGALTITDTGTVTLGTVNGIASLSARGQTITTMGVTTTGSQSYDGTVLLNGIYSGSSFTAGATQVTANSTVATNGGLANFGSTTGAGNLIVNAGAGDVRFGTINGLASILATGNTIALVGNATTIGAQTYNGATTLGGQYQSGGDFTINGAATTTDSTTVTTSGGNARFGAIGGAGTLTINAGAGSITLGALSNFALSATGATILTNGGNTGGAQTYNGATTLVGSYSTGNTVQGSAFTVNGTTTLGGNTSVTARGNAVFGAVNASGSDLTVNALGNGNVTLGAVTGLGALSVTGTGSVALGAVSGLGSLSVTGASIATAGAATSGAQTYTGTTTLAGAYSAGGNFTVNGSSILAGATNVTSGGNARFAAVVGTGSLGVTANGSVTLGSVNNIASLSATGATIALVNVRTIGAQSYTGATSLNGVYNAGGDFTVNGAATFGGNTGITTGGNATLGTIGGTGGVGVTATNGSVTLGAVTGLSSLSVRGISIVTAGATTSGSQLYMGAISLNGTYATNGGVFTVNGAATLAGNTTIATSGGNATLGPISATGTGNGLTVNAGAGSVALGAATGLGSLTATGASITTSGAATSGAQSYTGATTLAGAYTAGGGFTVNGATTLAGNTSVTTGGNASFGTVGGTGSLGVNAGTGNVTFGAVSGIASLSATGATIATAGAATSGAQTYNGATTLSGTYTAGGAFAANGPVTLGGATSVTTTGGNASLGAIDGTGNSLSIHAGSGTIALGLAGNLASLSATGASIFTAGATTSGAQNYTGATRLSGTYTAASLMVNGTTTLLGSTGIAGGDVTLGAVTGSGDLSIDSTGAVTLGAVSGLTNLDVAGASIGTAGASTGGSQSYTGATSLAGTYTAGAFTVTGATTLTGDTSVNAGGNASFGAIDGANALDVSAAGDVSLGAVNGLASLSVSGATIATSGAATSGAQAYNGATSLNGAYTTGGGSFAVNGAATTVNAVSVTTGGGNASLGTVSGVGGLTVNAGTGSVSLGAVSDIASLSATGATIATSGSATGGAQSYTGATSLNGAYTTGGGGFVVNGAATTVNAVSVTTTGGNASFGTVSGAGGLTVNAGTGSVSLGAVSGIASLSATGATIATSGAATSGAQSYTGATSLAGTYTTGGGAFTVTGAANLTGTISVTTAGGAIALGAVDAAVAGSQGLALNAGTGSVALGNLGAVRRLGATSVNGGATVLNGATYAANSLSFTGGTGASVRLTQGTTTFNTSLPGGAGGAITIQPDLTGTANAQQNVVFSAGNGLTVNSGDVAIGNAGTDAIRLGAMTVNAHDFSAATVKLAGTFTSVLSGSQAFTSNTLDTLGSVNARVAGNESGPIRAGGSVTIDAGGSGSGSIIAGGAVSAQYDSSVNRTITSQSNVTIESLGAIGGSVTAAGAVDLQTTTGAISSAVNAGGPVSASTTGGSITGSVTSTSSVELQTTSGAIASAVNAGGPVSASSTSGTITGAITSGGTVAIETVTGAVTSTVSTTGTASINSQTGAINATVTGAGGVSVESNGAIAGTYNSPTSIALTSTNPVNVQVNGSVVSVTAPSGSITGVFSEIHTNDQGTFVINEQPVVGSGTTDARQIIIDSFIIPTRGTVSANGEIQLPAGLALGLIAPAGNGQGGQRPPVVVNSVQRLGELLRQGYTAIIIQLDESNLDLEEEVAGQ